MRVKHWLLLAAVAASDAEVATAHGRALVDFKESRLAVISHPNSRQVPSSDLFEERYLVATTDTTNEVITLFRLYNKLYADQVAAYGSTEAAQLAYFEANVFPQIQEKADQLLLDSGRGTSSGGDRDTELTFQRAGGNGEGDSTTSPTSSGTALGTAAGTTNGAGSDSIPGKTTFDGTATMGGTSTDGTTASGTGALGGATTGHALTPGGITLNGLPASGGTVSGGTTSGGALTVGGTTFDGAIGGGTFPLGGTPTPGGINMSGGTSALGGNTADGATSGGTSSVGGTQTSGGAASGGASVPGGTTAGGTLASGGTTLGGASLGGTTTGGFGAAGGTADGGEPPSGGAADGGEPPSGGAADGGEPPSGGTSSGTTPWPHAPPRPISPSLVAASVSPATSTASGSSFWSTTYNPTLSSTVNSLRSQTSTLETVVHSSSPGSSSDSTPLSAYTSPTVISGYTSPSRRVLATGRADTSTMDVLFCDVAGNAIWKWRATDVPDATSTNASYATTAMDVSVDRVCSATTTLGVSAYQSGCSLQNHPEGCDNVYYKGCGGITVSPTSERIVIARTGGRTLGVLHYKRVERACQGQVVDAIATYRGKRFNSPTFAEYARNGILYFTDSPFGLATSAADFEGDTLDQSPLRELAFNGVYMLRNGSGHAVELVDCTMTRPNKIAFSPANDVMYITNSQRDNSYVKRYVLAPDGTVNSTSVFFNFTAHPELATHDGFAKGIKVDDRGFVYVVCHKGVYIFSPQAELAGAIMSSEELDSVAMGLGRLFISGSFGLVAQTSGVPSQTLPRAQLTCSA